MEENVRETLQNIDRAEADLRRLTSGKEPAYPGLESKLSQLREACQDLFFLDLQVAESTGVEARLWRGHQKVNSAFRSYLGSLRREENRKKTVERRKAEKLYLDFIKSSHRFYRGFIQRICSHFADLGEIYDVARKMHLQTLSADPPVHVDVAQKQSLLRSCHMTLIQCGDLSRYREIELSHKERNWGPAKGYYECAAELDPTSGHSFNQLSVIALADGDHFRALYYIYRSLATANPFPEATGNLATELKKIRVKPIEVAGTETKLGITELPFLKFHGMSHADEGFPEFRSHRDALMRSLSETIREQPCNKSLKRLCLLNIAASYQAAKSTRELPKDREQSAERLTKPYRILQDLNISTFIVLLLVFSSELQAVCRSAIGTSDILAKARLLTPVCRRILPCLRLYSAWLLTDLKVLRELEEIETCSEIILSHLWGAFAGCLNALVAMFPVNQLANIPYLLAEDQDMLHFAPLDAIVCEVYLSNAAGVIKPHQDQLESTEFPPAERPDYEMMHRVKGLVKVGVHLFKHRHRFGTTSLPWIFGGGKFITDPPQINDLPQQSPSSVPLGDSDNLRNSEYLPNGTPSPFEPCRTPPDTMAVMVDDLVGAEPAIPRTTSSVRLVGSPSGHAAAAKENAKSPSTGFTAPDLVHQISQQASAIAPAFNTPGQPLHRGSFSVYQTPFAPLPGELTGVDGHRPGTSHNTTSPRFGLHGSSAAFKEDLNRRQRELSDRSSPHASLDPSTMSTISNNPTGFYTFAPAQAGFRPMFQAAPPSPFASPDMEVDSSKKTAPLPNFGAIGDSRPKSARTPTSGQPG